ncbi:Outer membrane lipoprotein omp19 [Neorhizobium galegae bv. officinalis bv. officinalis str. HAMBI 1141]|uniref:Outer membrane lipoprotein omp19 n=1 Tax=Neorhizobium galegae bv. officinalis bv. officinalis str. HAMBI 1141 TaxID=1028801 RepID=A0A068TD28_NEOGA|nr:protease inhibitor Inh/omp19 family protein [Neorhizobium galegae]CDN55941.1 Outer membrane lipoprotein omp19 [Neorhizobium galegae bv. officinalis bv. officinalis str. HAMBI 1141]
MQFRYVATGLVLALALAGCQRTSYSPYSDLPAQPSQPAPLQAQPVPSVQGGQLPPPAGASQFPSAPGANPAMASANPAAPPASALDVKKEAMVGNWRVSNGGSSCDMFLTLTNLGGGSRGGTRGCAGELTAMGSWEVSGKMVQFKNRAGDVIGRVYKSAENRFDGTMNSGQQVSLSR